MLTTKAQHSDRVFRSGLYLISSGTAFSRSGIWQSLISGSGQQRRVERWTSWAIACFGQVVVRMVH